MLRTIFKAGLILEGNDLKIGGVASLIVQNFEERVYEELRNLSDEILLHTDDSPLYDKDEVSSSFIGSNMVLENRLGSTISMITAYGISVEGSSSSLHINSISNTLGSKKPFPLIITPKRNVKTRGRIFQRIYELLTALHAIDYESHLFFNWDYSEFLSDILVLEDTLYYKLLGKVNSPDVGQEIYQHINHHLYKLLEDLRENIPAENARESFRILVDLLPKTYNDLFESIASMKIFTGNEFNDIVDYVTIAVEKGLFESLLKDLLVEARRKNISMFWITSNPNSNYIGRINPILSWINDTVILSYIWRNLERAALDINHIVEERIMKTWVSTLNKLFKKYAEQPPGYLPRSNELILEHEIGDAGLWYAKFARQGPIIQVLYPRSYERNRIEDGLRELYTTSDKRTGYPKPLVLVKKACRISEEVARGLGDSLLRRTENQLLRMILNRPNDFFSDVF